MHVGNLKDIFPSLASTCSRIPSPHILPFSAWFAAQFGSLCRILSVIAAEMSLFPRSFPVTDRKPYFPLWDVFSSRWLFLSQVPVKFSHGFKMISHRDLQTPHLYIEEHRGKSSLSVWFSSSAKTCRSSRRLSHTETSLAAAGLLFSQRPRAWRH